ncbi:hypothetical protein VWN47_10085, partial [Campylobacter jejuni]
IDFGYKNAVDPVGASKYAFSGIFDGGNYTLKNILINAQNTDKEETAKMLSGESFGDAGKLVVIEEFLDGYELSIFAVCDGNDFVL